jgi:hypothetical protein
MTIWKKLFGGTSATPADASRLPLASQVTDKQSLDLFASKTVFALIGVVPKGTSGPRSDAERQSYIWALYEASNPKMSAVVKGDKHVIRAYYYELPHMKPGHLLDPDHWFDAQEEYRLPGQYSSLIHFLNIAGNRLRFRLQEPGKPESKFDVAIPPALAGQLAAGPADVTMITVFASNEPLCIPTMWPLRPKTT